jgi:hypothetical protein
MADAAILWGARTTVLISHRQPKAISLGNLATSNVTTEPVSRGIAISANFPWWIRRTNAQDL